MMHAPPHPTLADYAIQLKADPRLLHALVATAKRSNSPVIRYGAIALDAQGNIAGTGYSKMAETEAEKRWGDEHTPPRLHAEMSALCDAQSKGYDVAALRLFILPLAPAENPLTPEGYIMLRDMEHAPCFSCGNCGPKLARLGVPVNILNGERGWVTVSPEQAQRDGERMVALEQATGKRCRAGSIPGSLITDAPLDAPGYRYIPAALSNLSEINGPSITPAQETHYAEISQTHALPATVAGDIAIPVPLNRPLGKAGVPPR